MNIKYFFYLLVITNILFIKSNPIRHLLCTCNKISRETIADIQTVLKIQSQEYMHTSKVFTSFFKRTITKRLITPVYRYIINPIQNIEKEANPTLNNFFARTAFQKTVVGVLATYGVHALAQPGLIDSFLLTTTAGGLTLGTTFYRYTERKTFVEGHQTTQKALTNLQKTQDAIKQELQNAEIQRVQLTKDLQKANETIKNGFGATKESFQLAEQLAHARHQKSEEAASHRHNEIIRLLHNQISTHHLLPAGDTLTEQNNQILLCSAT